MGPPPAATVEHTPKKAMKPATATVKPVPGKLVNLNTAPKEEADASPGIGPVKAQAIIDARPFSPRRSRT